MEPFKFNTTATEIIPLAKLENNTGQVEGLPGHLRTEGSRAELNKNPRQPIFIIPQNHLPLPQNNTQTHSFVTRYK